MQLVAGALGAMGVLFVLGGDGFDIHQIAGDIFHHQALLLGGGGDLLVHAVDLTDGRGDAL